MKHSLVKSFVSQLFAGTFVVLNWTKTPFSLSSSSSSPPQPPAAGAATATSRDRKEHETKWKCLTQERSSFINTLIFLISFAYYSRASNFFYGIEIKTVPPLPLPLYGSPRLPPPNGEFSSAANIKFQEGKSRNIKRSSKRSGTVSDHKCSREGGFRGPK